MSVVLTESEAAIASPSELWTFPRPTEQKKTVLVIEDDQQMSRAIARRLFRAGYDVTVAGDGRCGLDLAMELEPDAILMDLGLPRMSGFTLLHQLRDHLGEVPLMIVTGNHDPGIADQAASFGVARVFRKPFAFGRLMRTLKATLDGI